MHTVQMRTSNIVYVGMCLFQSIVEALPAVIVRSGGKVYHGKASKRMPYSAREGRNSSTFVAYFTGRVCQRKLFEFCLKRIRTRSVARKVLDDPALHVNDPICSLLDQRGRNCGIAGLVSMYQTE